MEEATVQFRTKRSTQQKRLDDGATGSVAKGPAVLNAYQDGGGHQMKAETWK